ncbi:unnamed protein product [Dibothriocephalus latus]|uniref:Uncharacterized protein n=1 Tax=Dibothriocephalus latus TaxID=60516 RepID=A0A3P7MC31_DIBLA|nr:unnamed protein product [Dibothriocephalus latus]
MTESGKVLLILTEGGEGGEEEKCERAKHDKPTDEPTLGALEKRVRLLDFSGLPLIATVPGTGAKGTCKWTWDVFRPESTENAVSTKPLLSLYIGPRPVHGKEPAKPTPSMLVVQVKICLC